MRTLLLNKKSLIKNEPVPSERTYFNLSWILIWYLLIIIDLFSGHTKFFLKKFSTRKTHPWPSSKSKFNLKSDRVNLVAPASPIYPISRRYSTNWDRKGWPGSEIQSYYGWPWESYFHTRYNVFNHRFSACVLIIC